MRDLLTNMALRLQRQQMSLAQQTRWTALILGSLLLLLSVIVLGGSIAMQRGVTRIVDHRFGPITAIHDLTTSYEHTLDIANKVRLESMTEQEGLAAIEGLQRRIDESWAALDEEAPPEVDGTTWESVAARRKHADEGVLALRSLLHDKRGGNLDVYVAHVFNRHVDPLLLSADHYVAKLRASATEERRRLSLIVAAIEAMIIISLVTGTVIGVAMLYFSGVTVIQPLTEIARFTAATGSHDGIDVPHRDRPDEIGDIARAIAGARARRRRNGWRPRSTPPKPNSTCVSSRPRPPPSAAPRCSTNFSASSAPPSARW